MNVTTYRDPLMLSIAIAQERAKALILWEMETKKQEFSQLIKKIPSISKDAMKSELAELIELGLVSRVVHVKKKSQFVEYALTNRGAQLLKCLRKMMNIGIEVMMDYGMSDLLVEDGYIEKVQITEEEEEEFLDHEFYDEDEAECEE